MNRASHGQTLRMRLSSPRFVRNAAALGTLTYCWAPFKQMPPCSYRAEKNLGPGLTGSPLVTTSLILVGGSGQRPAALGSY